MNAIKVIGGVALTLALFPGLPVALVALAVNWIPAGDDQNAAIIGTIVMSNVLVIPILQLWQSIGKSMRNGHRR